MANGDVDTEIIYIIDSLTNNGIIYLCMTTVR